MMAPMRQSAPATLERLEAGLRDAAALRRAAS